MAKNDKPKAPETVTQDVATVIEDIIADPKAVETALPEAVAEVAVAELAPAAAPVIAAVEAAPKQVEQALVDLGTHARLNVAGYKDHWWTSIERFARSHGLTSYKVTVAKAEEVLKAWGAKLK